uniref:Conserved plasma membrane protein n=1 Tax=Macrostomum lignano TaxID=282301 RepID=A0A1I8F5T0_9PLAT
AGDDNSIRLIATSQPAQATLLVQPKHARIPHIPADKIFRLIDYKLVGCITYALVFYGHVPGTLLSRNWLSGGGGHSFWCHIKLSNPRQWPGQPRPGQLQPQAAAVLAIRRKSTKTEALKSDFNGRLKIILFSTPVFSSFSFAFVPLLFVAGVAAGRLGETRERPVQSGGHHNSAEPATPCTPDSTASSNSPMRLADGLGQMAIALLLVLQFAVCCCSGRRMVKVLSSAIMMLFNLVSLYKLTRKPPGL